MTALVVDDSRLARLLIRNILTEMGTEVVEAANGLEALGRLEEHPEISLALVDWNMPLMNGIEFIKEVRSRNAHDGLRIMMVTTETEAEQVARAMDAGANEYLMKPFSKEVLIAKLSMLDAYGD